GGRGAGGARAALGHARAAGAAALVLTLVDLPDVGPADVRAVLEAAGEDPSGALVRAAWGGHGGHPVLVGRAHWAAAARAAASGEGLRALLRGPACREVQRAGALRDVDVPGQLPAGTLLPRGAGGAGGGPVSAGGR
ncbi:NTP transferase domain-containing protein, partial [Kineococcus indalonis]|uniref:NTP transferase domain-containing protein n=1 Tax=Kineococcus indalonis TaxID=2696566 RepID=UPI0014123A56